MKDPRILNYYERLDISEDADQEEVKAAHRRLVKELHSDHKSGPYRTYFDDLLKGVNEAYDTLKDPEKRAGYDLKLRDAERRRNEETARESADREARRRAEEAAQQAANEQRRRAEEERRRRQEESRQENQQRAEEARRRQEAEARAAEERRRREDERRRQETTTPQPSPKPGRRRGRLPIGLGVLCAAIVVGLIAALAYSLTGEDTLDFTLTSTLTDDSESVAFSPDGSLLASGGEDGTVKLWDPQSGEEIQTLTGHSDHVRSVAFSSDGRLQPRREPSSQRRWQP